ncbi:MAG: hypothetical protein AAF387_22235 [Pseudomonadota bacterium]
MSSESIYALSIYALAIIVCVLPFAPALVEWLRKTDADPLVVVREQDANIRHFAGSFFDRIQSFFAEHHIDPRSPPPPFNAPFGQYDAAYFVGNEQKPEFGGAEKRNRVIRSVLISTDDLLLEGGYVFEQEIYCGRQLYAGSNNTYRAVYAGTDLILGPNSTVARWLHSQGHVYIGEASRALGRISSASSITLAKDVIFERLNATVIRFESDTFINVSDTMLSTSEPMPQAPPGGVKIDENTLLFTGNTHIPAGSTVDKNVISKGDLLLGAECAISGNLKSYGRLTVGRESVVHGSLICERNISVERSCKILGPIVSETQIHIGPGCVIGLPESPTSVTAPEINIAIGSELSGTLWASKEGKVISVDQNDESGTQTISVSGRATSKPPH